MDRSPPTGTDQAGAAGALGLLPAYLAPEERAAKPRSATTPSRKRRAKGRLVQPLRETSHPIEIPSAMPWEGARSLRSRRALGGARHSSRRIRNRSREAQRRPIPSGTSQSLIFKAPKLATGPSTGSPFVETRDSADGSFGKRRRQRGDAPLRSTRTSLSASTMMSCCASLQMFAVSRPCGWDQQGCRPPPAVEFRSGNSAISCWTTSIAGSLSVWAPKMTILGPVLLTERAQALVQVRRRAMERFEDRNPGLPARKHPGRSRKRHVERNANARAARPARPNSTPKTWLPESTNIGMSWADSPSSPNPRPRGVAWSCKATAN